MELSQASRAECSDMYLRRGLRRTKGHQFGHRVENAKSEEKSCYPASP